MDAQAMRLAATLFLAVLAAAIVPQAAAAGKPAHAYHRPHPPKEYLVYRIDRVTASIAKRHLVISVDGAVQSGGWAHARLREKPSAPEAPVLAFDFVADPPKPKKVVIQALLPVHVTLTRGLPHYGTVAVEVKSSTNEITTEITRWN
jgi:hypothetical protein